MNSLDLLPLLKNISWRESWWMLLGFIPALTLLTTSLLHRKNNTYAEPHLMPWVTYRKTRQITNQLLSKNSAYIIAWLLIGISVAGPRLPLDQPTHNPVTNINIMLVVDVSPSMRVTDIFPSRLRRAKIEIEEFLRRAPGTSVGIIVFAARPHLFVPLTSDHDALYYYLKSLDKLVLPTNGSNPAAALALARKELKASPTPSAIIILSDGDFPETITTPLSSDNGDEAIPIYALGIGSEEGGAIPLKNGKWLEHAGRPVISRLNHNNLQVLIEPKNRSNNEQRHLNHYSLATADDNDWKTLYDNGVSKLATAPKTSPEHDTIWQELFFWPLSLALIFLWFALTPIGFSIPSFLPSHFSTNAGKKITRSTASAIALIAACFFLYPYQSARAENHTASNTQTEINKLHAFQLYMKGNYSESATLYQDIIGYAARLGEGDCYYRLGNYSGAIHQYNQAVLAGSSDSERATALYNLANAYFRLGDYRVASDIYSDALIYNPGDKNIQHNLTFSLALKNSVDERARAISRVTRAGPGPQLGPANGTTENNLAGSLSIDQSVNERELEPNLPELANLSDDTLEALIAKGLQQIKLAANNPNSSGLEDYTRSKLSLINAHQKMSNIEDQQTILWKQLFEIEEGFPAPLSEPRNIPGEMPW